MYHGLQSLGTVAALAVVLTLSAVVGGAALDPIVSDEPAHLGSMGAAAGSGSEVSTAGLTEEVPNPLTPHEAKLTASDGALADVFGTSVALSGERALVGANGDDDLGSGSGAAYVFERHVDETWAEVAKLTASDGAAFGNFGVSVALSGERAVVGADVGSRAGSNFGAAYVFERQVDEAWTEVANLESSERWDNFGHSVALSGERVVVGADGDDVLGSGLGAVYVFERQADGTWSEVAKLTASSGVQGDYFGHSVALAGERAVVGANGDDDRGSGSGAVYVFERQVDETWAEAAKLTASDGAAFDNFGVSVALSGERAVVGADGDDDLGSDSGAVYVFERQADGSWDEVAKLTASGGSQGDLFGSSVALSADRALVGADGDDGLGSGSGAGYVFQRQADGSWDEVAKLTASGGSQGDLFGSSVALSPVRALVGASGDDDLGFDSGSAYVYSLQDCELELALELLTLRAGEELRAGVDLHHRRPVTVTVPFLLWIEDAVGRVVVRKSSPPITIESGDHRQLRMAVTLPQGMQPGSYRVLVGVKKMQQGIAWASRQFEIVE